MRRNIVWGKGITANIVSDSVHDQEGGFYYYSLIGRAQSGSPDVISSLHPEYGVGSPDGCTFCQEAHVVFTPYADPANVNRLMDIDFSCLTRWHPCKTKVEILPTAWNETMAEERSERKTVQQVCSPDVVRVLSRESRRVVIGQIAKTKTPSSGMTVLLNDDFKPWNLRPRLAHNEYSFRYLPMREKLGDRYALFFKYSTFPYPVDQNPWCEWLPATAENIEIVRRGVAEDWADPNDLFSLSPGLADLKPPTIQVH